MGGKRGKERGGEERGIGGKGKRGKGRGQDRREGEGRGGKGSLGKDETGRKERKPQQNISPPGTTVPGGLQIDNNIYNHRVKYILQKQNISTSHIHKSD